MNASIRSQIATNAPIKQKKCPGCKFARGYDMRVEMLEGGGGAGEVGSYMTVSLAYY